MYNLLVPITTNLFGDELNKQVDDLTKANEIGSKFGKVEIPSVWPWLACTRHIQTKLCWPLSFNDFCRRTSAFFTFGPERVLPQSNQRETEVNTIISNQYGFTGGQVRNFVS